jgi:hypothetical protein
MGLPQPEVDAMVGEVNGLLANSVLLEICAPGPLANNGDPGAPVTVWSGEAPGSLQRTRREGTSGERERAIRDVTFHVYDAVAPADELAGASWEGSTVVIRDETRPTSVTTRWTVKGSVKETEGTLDAITLELDGEAPR